MSPAYTKPLAVRLCARCSRRATVEVFNTYNASLGFHCGPCARHLIQDLESK